MRSHQSFSDDHLRKLNLSMRHINWHRLHFLIIKIRLHLNFNIGHIYLYLCLDLYLINFWLCLHILFITLDLGSSFSVFWLRVLSWSIRSFFANLVRLSLSWNHLWLIDNLIVSLHKSWSHSNKRFWLLGEGLRCTTHLAHLRILSPHHWWLWRYSRRRKAY